ncbi:MAG: DUF4350 domain-containing protein [Candidatus Njordarchaeales archaeon]
MKKLSFVKLVFILAIVFSTYPILAGYFNLMVGSAQFSILNDGENGLSLLRRELENSGFKTKIIVSSLNILRRINESSVLVIIAPTLSFTIEEAITILDFLMRGNGVLIVDDFSKANSLLQHVWTIISLSQKFLQGTQDVIFEGIFFNTTATLVDAGSFYKTPTNPVITNFNDFYGILSPTVKKIVTSFPSILSLRIKIRHGNQWISITTPLPGFIGLLSSTEYSWLETNLTSAINGEMTPDPWEWGGIPFSLGIAVELPSMGRLVLISDPDIFSNKLLELQEFDNADFSTSIIRWLAKDQPALVLFDESHLSHAIYDPLYGFSLVYKAVIFLSYSWLVAPAVPLSIISTLLAYVPRRTRFRPRIMSRVERLLGSPWLESRISWYKRSRNYRHMASVLLSSILFDIKRLYGIWSERLDDVLDELFAYHPEIAKYASDIKETLQTLDEISHGKQKINEEKLTVLVEKVKQIRTILRR